MDRAVSRLLRILDANPSFGLLSPVLLVLTVVTGIVDAVSILQLGRVFVANMTGNVVFTGFALIGAPGFSLTASVSALAGFLAGALLGGTLARHKGRDRRELARASLLRAGTIAELTLVGGAVLLAVSSGEPWNGVTRACLAALLAIAMGIQNAVARRLAVPDLTTTVLTMTLTGIAADLRAHNLKSAGLRRRILSVAAMLAGATSGALLVLHASGAAALGLAFALLAVATFGSVLAARGHGEPAVPPNPVVSPGS